MRIDAIVFDAVGTLIDPDPPAAEVYYRIGRRRGAALSFEEVNRRFAAAYSRTFGEEGRSPTSHAQEQAKWRHVVECVFQNAGAAIDPLFDALWRHFAQSESWSVYADVPQAWKRLEAQGYRLAIASNYDDRLSRVCRGLPPLDRCRRLFWSAQIGFSKPDPRFFEAVARRLQAPPGRILMLGDDLKKDVEGARAAGWRAMLVDREGTSDTKAALRSLEELPPLLD